MPSVAPAVDHLFKNVLDLDDDEIKTLVQLKYKTWTSMSRQLRLSQLDSELDNGDMPMSTYKCMKMWLLYYHKYFPAQNTISCLDYTIFDNVDMDALEASFRAKFLSATLSPPHRSLANVKLMAPAVQHLFTNILLLTDNEIYNVIQLKYTSWSTITNRLNLRHLDLELTHKCINKNTHNRMKYWLLYYKKYLPTQHTILSLDSTIIPFIQTRTTSTKIYASTSQLISPSLGNPAVSLSHSKTTILTSLKCCTANPAIEPFLPPISKPDHPTPTPVIHTTSAPSNTTSDDNTTAASFNHGFDEGYEASCNDFNSPPPNSEDKGEITSSIDDTADNHYDDNYEYATENCDYDDDVYDKIDPEPPPW